MSKKELTKKISCSLIFLYLFLLSMKLMSSSFKMFGEDFSDQLISLTSDPFVALFVGILVTSVVQSSSFTTSLTVGLVASGCLTLGGAIPIVLGANIGTTITNTIVSISHIRKKGEFKKAFEAAILHDIHNVLAVIIFFPLELKFHLLERSSLAVTNFIFNCGSASDAIAKSSFTSPLSYILNPPVNLFKSALSDHAFILAIISLAMLFFSLSSFVKILKPLAKTELKEIIHHSIFKNPRRSFVFGILLTAFVQSSSVTTSMIIPFAGLGILELEAIYPYVLGANVGTTITALLVAFTLGSYAAVTVAMAHCLFNLFGGLLIYPFKFIPIGISRKIGNTALTSRAIPLIYIAVVFFLVPFLIVFL